MPWPTGCSISCSPVGFFYCRLPSLWSCRLLGSQTCRGASGEKQTHCCIRLSHNSIHKQTPPPSVAQVSYSIMAVTQVSTQFRISQHCCKYCLAQMLDCRLLKRLWPLWCILAIDCEHIVLHRACFGCRQQLASSTREGSCGRAPFGCARSMAAWPALQKFTSELQAGEHLLRGGLLKQPCLLTQLEMVDNRPFLKLCRSEAYANSFSRFLTGANKRSPVVLRRLADVVAKLRDEQQEEWCNSSSKANPEERSPDTLGDGMEDTPRLRALPAKKAAALKKAQRKQLPIVTVPVSFGDECVALRVLAVPNKHTPPSVEACDANCRAMFCWSLEDRQLKGVSPPSRNPSTHEPRQGRLGKEYFRRDRTCWFAKRDKKTVPRDCVSEWKTMVCNPRQVGRPRKRARAAHPSYDSGDASASNSALDSAAPSDCPDSLQAASPSESAGTEF